MKIGRCYLFSTAGNITDNIWCLTSISTAFSEITLYASCGFSILRCNNENSSCIKSDSAFMKTWSRHYL